ncbi:MAG: hybrid sensor histidine kinase/response regulator [Dehalococcoidia bacterium]|nr:hybrid sensor histidine kinase/response regulator [Dehalococcoidia bacterium]
MDAGTSVPSGDRRVRGWLRVASDGRIEAANAALAEVLGAGGPLGLIGVGVRAIVEPSCHAILDAIAGHASRDRSWRGDLELSRGAHGLPAAAEAEPRGHGGFELRLAITVPERTAEAGSPEQPTEEVAPAPAAPAAASGPPSIDAPAAEPAGVLAALVGEIVHELGSPLAVISGYAEGLATLPADEQRRALEVIAAEAARAGGVLRALQTFARSEAHEAHEAHEIHFGAPDDLVAALRRVFAEARADLEERAPPRTPSRPSVLVVDDEESIRTLTAGVLQAGGYEARTAASAEEALALLEERGVDAVITDIRMPGMSGVALHAEIARRWPDLARRVVIVSGDVQTEAVVALSREFELPALEKPFRLEALRAALTDVLARGAPGPEANPR